MFRCEAAGYEVEATKRVLGAFDGRDRRDLNVYALPDRPSQLLVSMHEMLHHELHWSTGWGLMAAMAGLLSEADPGLGSLRRVAAAANAACRQVHEVFATTISCGVVGIEQGRRLLDESPVYRAYLDEGLHLGGSADRWPWQFRESAAQVLLRAVMQPTQVAEFAERGLEHLRVKDVSAPAAYRPDTVLAAVTAEAGMWWDTVFEELAVEYPDRGGDRGGPWGRSLPDDPEAMERLKAWEETVLIPRLNAVAVHRLRGQGIEVLDETGYLATVDLLRRSFLSLAPPDWQVEVLTEQRRMTQEPLGAERESIVLHATAATVSIIDQDELAERSQEFLFDPPHSDPHVLALYLPRPVLMRQFPRIGDLGAAGPPILALAGRPKRTGTGGRDVPLALMKVGLRPRQLVEMFTSLPTVLLTTLTTTREQDNQQAVLELDRVYVLLDLPLSLQVNAWVTDGWTVRFRVLMLGTEHPLNLVVFELDKLPSCCFLSYRGDAGFSELTQLLDRHPDHLQPGLTVDTTTQAAIGSITSWLMAAWWRIDEVEHG
ncbi:hypothetical protein [Dactylosporangium sp. NPDC050588]|uniref:hypothetical protein n=1 Tax=Dactylosporangium sp. NPDC050588 TaxID=3157211 RepID=UPI0033CD7F03